MYLSCSGCVGQQVSDEPTWPCFLSAFPNFTGSYECKVTATRSLGAYVNM